MLGLELGFMLMMKAPCWGQGWRDHARDGGFMLELEGSC